MDYIPPKQKNYSDVREYKGDQVMEFLKKIAMLESSNGDNTNHRMMKEGLHAGTHAVGNYGMMPLTAQDLDRQHEVNQLQDIDKLEVQDKLQQDPALQERLAQTLASKLLNKNPSDVASYKWEQGQYSDPSEEDLKNSPRIRKFKALENVK